MSLLPTRTFEGNQMENKKCQMTMSNEAFSCRLLWPFRYCSCSGFLILAGAIAGKTFIPSLTV
jgi:hypothetical protein